MSAHRHARRAGVPPALAATAGWSAFAVLAGAVTVVLVGGSVATATIVLVVGTFVVAVIYALVRFSGMPFPSPPPSSPPPEADTPQSNRADGTSREPERPRRVDRHE